MTNQTHNRIVSFIWSIADDVLRDKFERAQYRVIILPMTVLRRLDAILKPTKSDVLAAVQWCVENDIEVSDMTIGDKSGQSFYNTSPWTMETLSVIADNNELHRCFIEYLNGFSDNVKEIVWRFRFRDYLVTLADKGLLGSLLRKFTDTTINLAPEPVTSPQGAVIHEGLSNRGMGIVFEELLRKFNDDINVSAGQFFTPRDIIELMTHLVFDPVLSKMEDRAPYRIYDDACGSGGMLMLSKEFLDQSGEATKKTFNISLYGQETADTAFAICQGDMLISGQDPTNIVCGSTLSADGHTGKTFDFMLANPPYGYSWKEDQDKILEGPKKDIIDPRFQQTLPSGETLRLIPSSSDGQLLFAVNMLTKMKQTALGSRIAVVHNGSALFTGDAGSGESNIRRWMLENDWLEAIVALPLKTFYNTGIATYIWIFANKKAPERKGKVQLIDASKTFHKLRKNQGDKSHYFDQSDIEAITLTYLDNKHEGISKIFNNEDFGYRKITVERPLRLQCDLTKRADAPLFDAVLERLQKHFGADMVRDFTHLKLVAERELKLKWKAKEWTQFRALCCTRDEGAEPVLKPGAGLPPTSNREIATGPERLEVGGSPALSSPGIYEADPQLRDTENVPLRESIHEYFEREVRPHAPDAWIDESKTQIGAEISFTKYFYQFQPLRPLGEITRDILDLENQTEGLLNRLARELTE